MKLNLGCGTDYKEGWVNVDKGFCKCDVKHDIEILPWPFDESSVQEIYLAHVIEHIEKDNFFPFIKEMHRVCRPGATVEVFAPYALSDNFFTDPTHKMPITLRSFDYFDESKFLHEWGRVYGYEDIKININIAEYIENKPWGPDLHFILTIIK